MRNMPSDAFRAADRLLVACLDHTTEVDLGAAEELVVDVRIQLMQATEPTALAALGYALALHYMSRGDYQSAVVPAATAYGAAKDGGLSSRPRYKRLLCLQLISVYTALENHGEVARLNRELSQISGE